jgi:hypothetical protein
VSVHEQGPSLVPETHYIAASGKVHFKVIKQYFKVFLKTCALLSISGVSADYTGTVLPRLSFRSSSRQHRPRNE